MMVFRSAAPSDLSAIMEVIHQAQRYIATLGIDQWQDGYPTESLIRDDIRLKRAYVCEDDHILAYAVLTPVPEPAYADIQGAWHIGEPYLTIHRMALDDSSRHHGAAARILENAYALARSQSLSGIRIDTHRGNVVMRSFLEKNGFRECGIILYPEVDGDPTRIAYDHPVM